MTDKFEECGGTRSGNPYGTKTRSLDELLEVLANEQRRCLLAHLLDRNATVVSFDAVTDGVLAELERRRGAQPDREVIATDLWH